jgi:hypothetical protein
MAAAFRAAPALKLKPLLYSTIPPHQPPATSVLTYNYAHSASSLRLVRTDVEQNQATEIATTFENSVYQKAQSKVSLLHS